jgi:hypothetical protein
MQQLQPGITETTVKTTKIPQSMEVMTFTATVCKRFKGEGAPTGTVQFILDDCKVSNPVTLDSNGRASGASSLEVGQHQIVAKYIPTGGGGLFMASRSPEKSHAVSPVGPGPLTIAKTATGVDITYTGTLQAAVAVTGPYADVSGATSPYSAATTRAAQFFRAWQ